MLTMSSLPRCSTRIEKANVVTVHAAKEKYVFMIALCWSSADFAMAELKLGQNSQRKRVPGKGNVSVLTSGNCLA